MDTTNLMTEMTTLSSSALMKIFGSEIKYTYLNEVPARYREEVRRILAELEK